MTRKRRSFTAEYKAEAVRRVTDSGRPIAHVARELGLGEQLLGRWVRTERDVQNPVVVHEAEQRSELARLRAEVSQLRADNEFLGKAAAFFASKHPGSNASN